MKVTLSLSVGLVLILSGCAAPVAVIGEVGATAYLTKSSEPPPANLGLQMAQHENWCYRTLADTACYPKPLDTDPERLVNVDPASKFPLTRDDYKFAVLMTE